MNKVKQALSHLETAINSNLFCSGNILLSSRVFRHIDAAGKAEILVSLSNRSKAPHYLGHVFFKDGKYHSSIIALEIWLNPQNASDLFKLFWEIVEQGHWQPVGGDSFASHPDLLESALLLGQMIRDFDPINGSDEIDYRIVNLYPFPEMFPEGYKEDAAHYSCFNKLLWQSI